jgi:hypothetical protein
MMAKGNLHLLRVFTAADGPADGTVVTVGHRYRRVPEAYP